MTTDLQARLRYRAELDFGKHDELNDDFSDTVEDTLAWQAADEIARLEKQSTRLNDDRNEIRRELQGVQIKADALTEEVERLEKYKDTILEEHFEMAAYLSDEGQPNEFAGVRRFEGRAQAVDELVDVLGAAIRGDALTDYQGDGK